MKSKDQILLEQAYTKVYEDAQDAPQDAALMKSIKEILLGAIRREELNEYSLEKGPIVPEIMQAIQNHLKAPKVDPAGRSLEPTKRDFDQEWKDAAATRKPPTGPEPKITRGPGAGLYRPEEYQ